MNLEIQEDTLANTNIEDVEHVISKVEKSFGITFLENEIKKFMLFGAFCDLVIQKINLKESYSCTSQQAFYKLRSAISEVMSLDKSKITPETEIVKLIPKKNRLRNVKLIEQKLGFKLNVLGPHIYIVLSEIILFVGFFIAGFYDNFYFIAFLTTLALTFIVNKFGNQFKFLEMKEVVNHVITNNYREVRRDIGTFNKSEIENLLIELFSKELGLEKSELTRKSSF